MDIKTLNRVSDYLKNATPEQITKIAENMAEKAPHLMPVQLSPQERAEAYIKMNIASANNDNLAISYTKGLIDCAYLSGLIDEAQNALYHSQLQGAE